MTQDGQAGAPGTVTALRRPPVRQSIVVRSGRRRTFDTRIARCRVATSAVLTAWAGPAFSAAWPR